MATTATGSDRIGWVDYAKGLCIILVVMLHTTKNIEFWAEEEGFLHYVVVFAQPFRMPDFFLVSGLFLAPVIDRPWRRYTDTKVLHFVYFYVLWATITFMTKGPGYLWAGSYEKLLEFPMAFIEPLGTLWFIYVLPIFFVVTKVLRDHRVNMWLAWIAAAILETARVQTGWTAIDEFCARGVYFLSGYLIASYVFSGARWVEKNTIIAMALLLVWGVVNSYAVFTPSPRGIADTIAHLPVISLVLGFAGAFALITTGVLLNRYNALRFIRYCGEKSLVIYLAFFLTVTPLKFVVVGYDLDVGWSSLALTVISVAFPLMLYHLVRGTRLSFLFERPNAFKLSPTPPTSASRPRGGPAQPVLTEAGES
ncbi:acyltransferase family protein [Alsobacter sp. SYSU M60028]|uniref:Acyltransferase family protein n=1 Tax=Alsobacter ponti TaxID=2962936 RepID=A0ABT1LAB0_9HYPH|nr:acyltransferase family protein [Alsobacter ponti]MCP8938415.1 acyltransferase family protein [Alsobacter ponti]